MVSLSDLQTSSLLKADMLNSAFIAGYGQPGPSELNNMINHSVGRLYAGLCDLNQDYNISLMSFVLTGNSLTTNFLDITTLPSLGYPAYWKVRQVEMMAPSASSADPFTPMKSIEMRQRHRYARFILNPVLRAPENVFCDWGTKIEILPAVSSAGTYNLLYIPQVGILSNLTDSIDGYFMSTSGFDEWISLDVAMKCLQKEESDVSVLQAQKDEVWMQMKQSMGARNASEPKKIVDVDSQASGWYGNNGGFDGSGW